MIEALIVTLREGVEAALIVGITLAYLGKIQRPDLSKPVYAALAAAVAGSVALAAIISRAQWDEDAVEGWIMLAAAFFVLTMILFMVKTDRRLRDRIEGRLGLLAGRDASLALFVFTFMMVLREGFETVLMLSAVELNSTALRSFIGTLLGLGAAIVFGVMFVKGSVQINLPKFFKVTTVILLFVAAQLIVSGLHELSEYGVLPSSKQEMAIVGPIVRNDFFFFVTILTLAALMVLFEMRRRAPAELPPRPASPAERRKVLWSARRERLWMGSVYASSFLFIVLVTAEFIYAKSASALSPATEVSFVNSRIIIPMNQVNDGDLHRYQVKEKGAEVRFLLMRKPDGKIATAFDACRICGAAGFYRGSNCVICKNCGAPINAQSIGMTGGCNPISLKSEITADSVIIREADIAILERFFRR